MTSLALSRIRAMGIMALGLVASALCGPGEASATAEESTAIVCNLERSFDTAGKLTGPATRTDTFVFSPKADGSTNLNIQVDVCDRVIDIKISDSEYFFKCESTIESAVFVSKFRISRFTGDYRSTFRAKDGTDGHVLIHYGRCNTANRKF